MLDIPLFDGGRSGAASRHAAARRQEMEASRQELLDDLELAARTAHRQAEDSVARISIADSGAEAAQEALFIVEERYRSGLARVVDLIEVQRALTEARVRALDARAQAWKAIAAVERVAGQEVLR
jgi:cobalt-zinc-cadmium efflux system outer membrane protein